MDIHLIVIIGFLVVMGYLAQCSICRWKKNLFLRLLPGFLTLAAAVGCWIPMIAIPNWDDLLAFICVFFLGSGTGLLWLGSLIAWIVYAVVRTAQKPKK